MNNIFLVGLVLSCLSWDFWMFIGIVVIGIGWIDLILYDCIGIFFCFILYWIGARVVFVFIYNGLGSKLFCDNLKFVLGWWIGEFFLFIRNWSKLYIYNKVYKL